MGAGHSHGKWGRSHYGLAFIVIGLIGLISLLLSNLDEVLNSMSILYFVVRFVGPIISLTIGFILMKKKGGGHKHDH